MISTFLSAEKVESFIRAIKISILSISFALPMVLVVYKTFTFTIHLSFTRMLTGNANLFELLLYGEFLNWMDKEVCSSYGESTVILFFSSVLGLLTFLAEKLGCYKTTLNCTDDVALFCEKMKYLHEPGQNFMLCHVTPTVINPDHENTSRL